MVAVRLIGGFGNYSIGTTYINCEGGIEAIDTDFSSINDVFDNVRVPYRIKQSKARIEGARIKNDPKLKFRAERVKTDSIGDPIPGLPVHCPECGSIFLSENYTIESSIIDIFGAEEACYKCNFEHAKVSDGLYRVISEVIEILYCSDLTHAALASLVDSSKASAGGRLSSKNLQRSYAAADPELGVLAKIAANNGKMALLFLTTVVPIVITVIYGQLQLNEARIANEFAKKSYENQTQTNHSENILKDILSRLSAYHFEFVRKIDDIKKSPTCKPSNDPASAKPTSEPGSVNFATKRSPKFRHHKRRLKTERRTLLNPRHEKNSTCD